MKRIIFALVTVLIVSAAVFSVLVLRPVPKVKAGHHGCSEATLKGDYGLVGSGWYGTEATPFVPADVSGLVTFDGKADLGGTLYNLVLGGVPAPSAPYTIPTTAYTVSSSCEFTVTFTDPSIFEGTAWFYGTVVDGGGDEVIGNVTGSGHNVTATFKLKKVAAEGEQSETGW